NRCHRQNMKTSIINGSEVSRLSVAIQGIIISKLYFSRPEGREDKLKVALNLFQRIVIMCFQ
ncbi:hypothetical protein, partial [Kosakonia oryzae]